MNSTERKGSDVNIRKKKTCIIARTAISKKNQLDQPNIVTDGAVHY